MLGWRDVSVDCAEAPCAPGWRWAAIFVNVTLLAASALGESAPPVSDPLLQRIANAYQSIIDYEVSVDVDVSDRLEENPPAKYTFLLRASKPHCWFSQEKIRSPIRYELTLVTDGSTVWAFLPAKNRYVATDAAQQSAERELLKEHHFRYVTRFEFLDRLNVKSHREGEKSLRDGGSIVKCVLLRIEPVAAEPWTELLWVDAKRHIVLKSVHEERRGEIRIRTRTSWKFTQINRPQPSQVFQFVAPEGAMQTNAVELR